MLYVQESDKEKVLCCRLGFGWNITIHGNKASDINRKASRSVIELSKEPIFNLYFC